jgi:hypothetical protein
MTNACSHAPRKRGEGEVSISDKNYSAATICWERH